MTQEELTRKLLVGFGATGSGVVGDHRLTVAWRLREADVAGNGDLEDFLPEKGFQVFRYLLA